MRCIRLCLQGPESAITWHILDPNWRYHAWVEDGKGTAVEGEWRDHQVPEKSYQGLIREGTVYRSDWGTEGWWVSGGKDEEEDGRIWLDERRSAWRRWESDVRATEATFRSSTRWYWWRRSYYRGDEEGWCWGSASDHWRWEEGIVSWALEIWHQVTSFPYDVDDEEKIDDNEVRWEGVADERHGSWAQPQIPFAKAIAERAWITVKGTIEENGSGKDESESRRSSLDAHCSQVRVWR